MKIKISKKTVIITLIAICAVIVLLFSTKMCIEAMIVGKQMKSATHAITINNETKLYNNNKIKKASKNLDIGTDVYILDEIVDNDGNRIYKVKTGKKVGYVLASDVNYYTAPKMKKELMLDVSQFNMQNNFSSIGDFKAFVIQNNIKYVYIRAGGRGYGQAGKFYKDTNFKEYADACEFLNIPFGFYFLDEAITSEEVDEEVKFIEDFIKENKYNYNKLPVALDVEKHVEKGRADEIWETRYTLINEMIEKLAQKDINAIVYSNANIANQYLTSVDGNLWLAYYPEITEKPDYWYSDTDGEGALNPDLISKMVGWQFTETGLPKMSSKKVDISLVYNDFFLNGSTEDIKKDMQGTNKRVLRVFTLKEKWKNKEIIIFGKTIYL